MVVVQPGERNMYDQHWLTATLKEKYPFRITDKLETFGVSVNFLVGKYWRWQSGVRQVGLQTRMNLD